MTGLAGLVDRVRGSAAALDGAGWRTSLAVVLPGIASGRAPECLALDGFDGAALGPDPVATLLTHQRRLVGIARSLAPTPTARLVAFESLAWQWTAAMIAAVASASVASGSVTDVPRPHRVDRWTVPAPADAALVVRILTGGEPVEPGELEAYGLNRHVPYHAFRAGLGSGLDEIAEQVGLGPAPGRPLGLFAAVDGDVWGFTAELPSTLDASVAIGVAAARPIGELALGFRQASRALVVARALGRGGRFTLDEAGVLAAVTDDRELGRQLADRYLAPVLAADGEEILSTVDEYLARSTRLGETARVLGVHANTVRYRLSRFEELADCSLREVAVLTEVWWALTWRRLDRRPGASHD